MISRPELVIFDCDGVLVDSEPIGNGVLAACLADAGVAMPPHEVEAAFRGLSMTSVVERVARERGVRLGGDFLAAYQARLFSALRHGVAAMRGAAEALHALGIARCVASSGEPEKMRLTLGLTGLLPAFDGKLFSAAQVAHGKPSPDLFLFAAERMGTPPSRCIVVEDSPAGVKAACAAGMTAYGYAPSEGAPNGGADERRLESLIAAGAKPLYALSALSDTLAR